jgi:hypothetical protein
MLADNAARHVFTPAIWALVLRGTRLNHRAEAGFKIEPQLKLCIILQPPLLLIRRDGRSQASVRKLSVDA